MDGSHTNVVLVIRVVSVHHLEQLDLDLGLVEERLLVLDDLDRNILLVDCIKRLHNLLAQTYAM